MRIASDGDVGIGTDSPSSKLHVNKAGDPNVIFENESNTSLDRNNTLSFNYSDGVGAFIKGTRPSGLSRTGTFLTLGAGGNTERLRIDALGNVGIGTTSPQASLHVNGDTILSGNLTITGTSLVAKNLNVEGTIISESGRIILHDTTIDGDKVIAAAGNNLRFFSVHGVFGNTVGIQNNRGSVKGMSPGSTSSDLGLFCNSIEGISIQNDGDVIVGNGNLGIATTSPSAKLHVNGDIKCELGGETGLQIINGA